MRRALLAAVLTSSLAFGVVSAVPAVAAPAAPEPVETSQFGMHVPGISQSVDPTIPYGAVRLWDSGVAWGQVEQKDNKYWWNGMDAAISNANAQKVKITYVLGSTPKWAASNTKQGTYPNKGAASMPKSMKYWKDWVTAVVKRYGDSIESYQIWNEANLTTFWQGTPKQMSDLTNQAAKIIRKYDPTAKIVSASSTVRLTSAYNKFFPAYLKELKKVNWPIDAIAVHLYPASTGTPGDRADYITKVKADMAKAGVPASKQLWDTEINYGIKGPGSGNPDKNIEGADAAAWVAQTYLDDVRLGVARAYWYYWDTASNLVGIQMYDGTLGALGYQTVESWLNGKFYSCTSGAVNVCNFADNVNPQVVAWASKGSGTFNVPANVSISCNALNQCAPVAPGSTVTIGSMPQWFGNPAS
jgi:GH35 family endo-1,4-beta-xylanase